LIENERKFVLSGNNLEEKIAALASSHRIIHQTYIDKKVRIRESYFPVEKYYIWDLTVKVEVEEKVHEIETEISDEDYEALSKVGLATLRKIRYVIDGWEIDFFKHEDKTYFIVAEYEMPENQEQPENIPNFIQESLIYSVEKNDGRFSSRKLSDVAYAKKLLRELKAKVTA